MIIQWISQKTGINPKIITGVMLVAAAVLWFSK